MLRSAQHCTVLCHVGFCDSMLVSHIKAQPNTVLLVRQPWFTTININYAGLTLTPADLHLYGHIKCVDQVKPCTRPLVKSVKSGRAHEAVAESHCRCRN